MSNKKPKDELVGFRDFLEHDERKSPTPTRNQRGGGFEMLTFLEREERRIRKMLELFQEKTFILKQFKQKGKIKEELLKENQEIKKRLVIQMLGEKSSFTENIDELLQNHFNN